MSTLKVNTLQNASGVEVYTAKAWVNFNGTGTAAIRSSGNVSSITDNGTGDYTVNFTSAFSDANYAACLSVKNNWPGGYHAVAVVHRSVAPTTSACRIENVGTTGGMGDIDIFNGAFFR